MSDQLQRHLSDSYAFAPRKPSRLGPGHPSRPQVRGTVSMPTSPILTRQTTSLWPDPPQSARGFFDLPTADPKPTSSGSWFPDAYPSSTETIQLNLKDDSEPEHRGTQPQIEYHSPESLGQGDPGSVEPARKKRAQVRIACIHCQKACKKCSNTRPCERCVKYGLKDCIDSTRKPRKTGIKRGPYKRRASIKYQDSLYSSSSPPPSNPTHPTHPSHAFNPLVPGYRPHHAAAGVHPNLPMGLVGADYVSSADQTATYAAQPSMVPRTRPAAYSTGNGNPAAAAAAAAAKRTAMPGPPGPRAAALHGAMVRALTGPRWVNGQRTGSSSSTAEVMYPPTPVVPFPISLNHQDDPFSRAVSPIHGDLDSALLHGLKTHLSSDDDHFSVPFAQTGTGDTRAIQAGPTDPSVTLDFNPFEPQSSISAPTSPRTSAWDATPPDLVAGARASSAEPVQSSNRWTVSHPLSTTMTGEPLHSPAIVALQKIRKPSLRTLMSHGGSLASSRQTSPIPESPTLYNQPMELDEGMENMGMSSAVGFGWSGGEFATTGQSGQNPQAEDRLDDPLSLMGPFDNPFQT